MIRDERTLSVRDVENILDMVERQARRKHSNTGEQVDTCYRGAIALGLAMARRTAARRSMSR